MQRGGALGGQTTGQMEFELALGVSTPFPAVNSNKREITLDLQRRERVAVLTRLVATADMLVENSGGARQPSQERRIACPNVACFSAPPVRLNSVQTYRSHRVAERLRDAVTPTATALRDGTWSEIRRRELAPGDIVRLVAGDRVPADARLLEARDLHVQQAALTGATLAS